MISTIEIILIAAYFIAIGVIGYRSSRKSGSEDFLLAKRDLGVFSNLATITATKITASVIITYIALVYIFGISAIWVYIGTLLGYTLFFFFAIRLKREADRYDYYTVSDYFRRRYGNAVGNVTAVVVLISFFMNFTIQLIGGAKIIQSLLGIDFFYGVLLAAGVILFYLYLGGFKAVVKTDVVQFVAIVVLFFALAVVLFTNFQYNPEQWQLMSAGPKMIIPLLLVGILFPFSAADLWQRAYAAKSVKTFKKSFILAASLYMVFGFILSVIGIIIKLKLGDIAADNALVEGFLQLLPPGLVGFGVIALFAAIMSSADSYAFITASVFIQDILYRNRPGHVVASRLKYGIVAVMGLGIICALQFKSIVDASFIFAGVLMVMSVVVLATWVRAKVHPISLNSALCIGVVLTVLFTIFKGISAMLVVVGIVAGLFGLLVGAVASAVIKRYRRRKTGLRLRA